MKRLLALFLALMLVLSLTLSMVACGKDDDDDDDKPKEEECSAHVDENNDGKCDKCEAAVEGTGNEGGNTGNEGGNTGNEGGNTGNEGGNTGNEGGNTGNEGGNTGNEGGNTGNEGGNTGNEGGNTGNEGGNTGNQPGDEPGNEPGDEPGNEPGDEPGNEPGDEPGNEPGDEPGNQPGDEPGNQPGGNVTVDLTNINVAELIYGILGEVAFEFYAEENSQFVFIDGSAFSSILGRDVDYVGIKVIEATVNTKIAVPRISFEVEYALVYDCDGDPYSVELNNTGAFGIELVGETLTVSADGGDVNFVEEYNVNEILYAAFAQMLGIPYESFMTALDIAGQVMSYGPVIVNMISGLGSVELPEITDEYVANLATLVQLVRSEAIVVSVEANGDVKYTVNVAALLNFIESVEGKTLAELIDEAYGAGATEAIASFITSLPNMTIRDIANTAIEFAESYGVDIDETYALINRVISFATGVDIDIEALINSCYDMTLAEVIATMRGGDDSEAEVYEVAQQIAENIEAFVDMVTSLTVDELYNLLMLGADADYSVIEELKDYVNYLDESTEIEITFDQYGVLKSLVFDVMGIRVTASSNAGTYLLSCVINGSSVVVTVNGNRIQVVVGRDGETYITYDVTVNQTYDSEGFLEEISISGYAIIGTNDKSEFEIVITDGIVTKYSISSSTYENYEWTPVFNFEYAIDLETGNAYIESNGSRFEISVVEGEEYIIMATENGEEVFSIVVRTDVVDGDDVLEVIYSAYDFELLNFVAVYGNSLNVSLDVNTLGYDEGYYVIDVIYVELSSDDDYLHFSASAEDFEAGLDVELNWDEDGDDVYVNATLGDGEDEYLVFNLEVVDSLLTYVMAAVRTNTYYGIEDIFSYEYSDNGNEIYNDLIIEDVEIIATTIDGVTDIEIYEDDELIGYGQVTEELIDGSKYVYAEIYDAENDNLLIELGYVVSEDGVVNGLAFTISGYTTLWDDELEDFVEIFETFIEFEYGYEVNGNEEIVSVLVEIEDELFGYTVTVVDGEFASAEILAEDVVFIVTSEEDGASISVYEDEELLGTGEFSVEDLGDGSKKVYMDLFDIEKDNYIFKLEFIVDADGVITEASLLMSATFTITMTTLTSTSKLL